jgi:hypothetical protein
MSRAARASSRALRAGRPQRDRNRHHAGDDREGQGAGNTRPAFTNLKWDYRRREAPALRRRCRSRSSPRATRFITCREPGAGVCARWSASVRPRRRRLGLRHLRSEDPRKAGRFNELEQSERSDSRPGTPAVGASGALRTARARRASNRALQAGLRCFAHAEALGHTPAHARDAEERVRAAIREDMLDTESRVDGEETIFSYPIAVLSSRKPAR